MTDRHKIVFYGEIIEGQSLETVKKNMGILFKMDIDKIDRLLSKPPILIKKDIDFPTATKYQEILKKAGAICNIEPMISEQKTSPVSTQPDENQSKYELVFYGDLVAGQDHTTVKKRLASLFKTDISKIDKFLSHQPAIIKKNVDLETASLYREAIMNAGAICIIKPAISMQRAIQVPAGSEKNSVSTPPPPSQTQKDNAPPSPKPIITEQLPPDSGVLQETRSELANSSGSNDKVSDPSGQDKTEKVQASEEPPQPPSNHSVCPQCHFEQESSNKCVRCGVTLQDFCKPMDQTVSPQGNDSEKLSSTDIDQSQGHQSSQHSNSFFKRLFHLNQEERKQIKRLIVGSAIVGAIIGFMWGGIYDPWRNQGYAAAILNFLLFGGWGLAEAMGLLAARNLGHAKSRKMLIFTGAICGGIWVSLFTALDMVTNPSSLGSFFYRTILGLITGFIIGGLISSICTINLSGIMSHCEEKTLVT